MKFTGERYVPSEQGEMRVEHYHRYAVAMQVAKDKLVLDLACGEGYGAALLSLVANQVFGVDISDEAIAHARAAYANRANLEFQCNSATDTSFPNEYFDLVISYETIEHLADQEKMLAEIRRVLKPNGILIVSSPNRPVYSDGRDYQNEFHVKELDFSEFDALLSSRFEQTQYYGQRLVVGTAVQPLDISDEGFKVFTDDGEACYEGTPVMKDPMYFIAVCGAKDVVLPRLDSSMYLPNTLDLVAHYMSLAKWAQQQDSELAIRDRNVLHYKNEAELFEKRIHELQQQITKERSELEALAARREEARREILRAEAQLALLKELWLEDGPLERL